jgi:hypothetical protein
MNSVLLSCHASFSRTASATNCSAEIALGPSSVIHLRSRSVPFVTSIRTPRLRKTHRLILAAPSCAGQTQSAQSRVLIDRMTRIDNYDVRVKMRDGRFIPADNLFDRLRTTASAASHTQTAR